MLDAIDIAGLVIAADALLTQRVLANCSVVQRVGQVFPIEREVIEKRSGKRSTELARGLSGCTPEQASPETVLRHNRGPWRIEKGCHYALDQAWDEDHCRIRTGHGPENTSRLRRFAIGVLKLHAKPADSIASMTRKLASKTRLAFDDLLMTKNATGHVAAA